MDPTAAGSNHSMTPAPCAFERAREDVARAIRAHAGAGEVRAAAGGEGDVPLGVEGRAIVGHAALLVLDELVAAAADAEAPVLEHADGAVPSLLAAALEWASATIAEPSLVFAMVEDLVAASTLADCEAVFTWLESNVDAVGTYFDKGKFALLRACNDLLRRLSKDADTVLCGRVVMLLAKLYPLSERSALNVTGKFNVGNVTEFEEADGQLDGTPSHPPSPFPDHFDDDVTGGDAGVDVDNDDETRLAGKCSHCQADGVATCFLYNDDPSSDKFAPCCANRLCKSCCETWVSKKDACPMCSRMFVGYSCDTSLTVKPEGDFETRKVTVERQVNRKSVKRLQKIQHISVTLAKIWFGVCRLLR